MTRLNGMLASRRVSDVARTQNEVLGIDRFFGLDFFCRYISNSIMHVLKHFLIF